MEARFKYNVNNILKDTNLYGYIDSYTSTSTGAPEWLSGIIKLF